MAPKRKADELEARAILITPEKQSSVLFEAREHSGTSTQMSTRVTITNVFR